MRISGMATGMDIEQIVSDLMKAERIPVDKLKQDRQTIEWKMEQYRDINRKLDTFRNNIFDTVIRQAKMLAKKVSSTNESIISATATSNAGNMTLRIGKVEQLATAASYNSAGKISGSSKINASATLSSQKGNFVSAGDWKSGVVHTEKIQLTSNVTTVKLGEKGIKDGENAIVKVNGKAYNVVTTEPTTEAWPENTVYLKENAQGEFELAFNEPIKQGSTIQASYITENATETFTIPEDSEGKTTFQVKKGGLDASLITVQDGEGNSFNVITDRAAFDGSLGENDVFVNVDTGQLVFRSLQKNKTINVEYAQNYTTANITAHDENGKEVHDNFIFTANQSLNQVFTELNRSPVKVNGFYDEHTGKVNISRTETGVFNEGGAEIMFGGFLAEALQLNGNGSGGAQNAKFTVNGLDTERRSNTFTLSGMTVALKGTSTEEITLGATTDTDSVFDTIKGFVDEYNELIDLVNGKLKEDRHRDYRPLTDDQKEALSDKEVEKWEEKAKSGLLRNDQALRTPFDRMRVDVYSAVNGNLDTEFRQLSAIGITTSKDYMAGGKLEINEDKLRAAIEKDAEGVYQLFSADGDSFGEKGIARRMRDTLDHAITSLADRAGGFKGKVTNDQFTLGRSLDNINDRITNFERRLKQVEERYWRQFNAMESAVQRSNSQAEMLFAQLMGGNQ